LEKGANSYLKTYFSGNINHKTHESLKLLFFLFATKSFFRSSYDGYASGGMLLLLLLLLLKFCQKFTDCPKNLPCFRELSDRQHFLPESNLILASQTTTL
jgi:hypothetical protein